MAGVKFGIVGCGNIATPYARSIAAADGVEVAAAVDALPGRAEALVAEFGGVAHASLEALLADEAVDAVVNLTAAVAHVDVTRAALEAGKHVHSEKPLALRHSDAQALVELADERGLLLSASPATLLGEAQQTFWRLVRDGAIGEVRVAYAEANWGRIERWHPTPLSILSVGAMGDVGVYPLAILTAIFGPVRAALGYTTMALAERVDRDGASFTIEVPDFTVALLEHETGLVSRVTASFYTTAGYQRGIELQGDDGLLWLPTWLDAGSRLLLSPTGNADDYAEVEPLRPPYPGVDWSRPLVDLAAAVREGRRPRASGEHAAHLVEVLEAIERSNREGGRVAVRSSFPQPEPMPWAS
ncbi:MAG TPA: Gfo/Idh/MocA family oxidoreductase [Gaiellaceae bacterium]|nr:Gfo/Idh/MocA family oxidoreductase [Gaiellaceae bacterium]